MSKEEDIVPITRGRQRPDLGSFAVIAGPTGVEGCVDTRRPGQRAPAQVVEIATAESHSDQKACTQARQATQKQRAGE